MTQPLHPVEKVDENGLLPPDPNDVSGKEESLDGAFATPPLSEDDAQPVDTQLAVANGKRSVTVFAYLQEAVPGGVSLGLHVTCDGEEAVELSDVRVTARGEGGVEAGAELPTRRLSFAESWDGELTLPLGEGPFAPGTIKVGFSLDGGEVVYATV
ncbi:hypothetical protein KRX56_04055 [Dermabacteraceae bacterium TAE3-ERU27]|nr:hypothetical protein [Dermabacteraceae bacterium TAE3-ERU27]